MRNVYTVSKVNSYIKDMFRQDFMLQSIAVQGEVSNITYHASGHLYFTLKDQKGTLQCVMFYWKRKGLAIHLEQGQSLVVTGRVDIYEKEGKYELYAEEIRFAGEGALYVEFERLKKELLEMGMFDASYKQPIPRYIHTLGVVTAPTGAAVRDIIQITRRRNPYVQIVLYPAIVQGQYAAESIVSGIHALEQYGVDTMIVGRGGGSIEDLWAFNERIVAEAIFHCQVPVISAVGHETDTTIADLAADKRAPTPSAAAELAVFEYRLFEERCMDLSRRYVRCMQSKCALYKSRMNYLRQSLVDKSPQNQVKEQRRYTITLEQQMQEAMRNKLLRMRHQTALYAKHLQGLSPLGRLQGGFGYVQGADGKGITDVEKVMIGDEITVHLLNGKIKAAVIGKEESTTWNRKE